MDIAEALQRIAGRCDGIIPFKFKYLGDIELMREETLEVIDLTIVVIR